NITFNVTVILSTMFNDSALKAVFQKSNPSQRTIVAGSILVISFSKSEIYVDQCNLHSKDCDFNSTVCVFDKSKGRVSCQCRTGYKDVKYHYGVGICEPVKESKEEFAYVATVSITIEANTTSDNSSLRETIKQQVTAGEKWRCLLFKDAIAIYSDQEDALFNVISTQAIQEWPIEHSMVHVSAKMESRLYDGNNRIFERREYEVSHGTYNKSRITEIREGSTAIDYTYTSSVTEYFVASNTSVTDLNGNELPGVMDQIALSNRELIVIFTAAGSAVLIAVCASICTYWKLKTGLR
ncbi:hypothetical protein DPMN_023878, partial [Dreissena polymorpha]